ncbi:MAG: polyhydroxyalkanoic acid system family protein [Pseudobdellovibrionaceae bacterium]
MPKVTIDHASNLSANDAFAKIKTFFETDQDIRRFDPKMSCQFSESSMTGRAAGSQFKADIAVKNQGPGSLVQVIIDLPLMLTPFKGKVQETIQKKLNQYLA